MSRLKTIDPAKSEGRVKELFDGPLKGKHFNLFKGFANSPAVLDAYLAFSGALNKSALTGPERELVALATAEANDCAYCRAAHTAIGKSLGIAEDQTVQARRGAIAGDPRRDAIVKFTLRLHEKRGHVSDQDLTDFRAAGFNDGHIAEVIAAYALNVFTNYFNHVNDTAVDFPAPPALK